MKLKRTIVTACTGGISTSVALFVTFRLLGFGWNSNGILLSAYQSPKLIRVWTQLEPLPLVYTHPWIIAFGMIFFSFVRVMFLRLMDETASKMVRVRTLTIFTFLNTYAFWEFFTPFNQYGEPLPLIMLELFFWLIIAFVESVTIVHVYHFRPFSKDGSSKQ